MQRNRVLVATDGDPVNARSTTGKVSQSAMHVLSILQKEERSFRTERGAHSRTVGREALSARVGRRKHVNGVQALSTCSPAFMDKGQPNSGKAEELRTSEKAVSSATDDILLRCNAKTISGATEGENSLRHVQE